MFDAVADAWKRGDTAAAAKAANTAGLNVTKAQLDMLAALVARTNDTREVRLLEPAQVLDAIAAALADEHGVGIVHGGEANVGEQRTTLCLAYRYGTAMTVGVGLSRARGAGPGVTWRPLQPWSKVAPKKNVERLAKWATAKKPDRVRFSIGKQTTKLAKRSLAGEDVLLAAVLADPDDDAPRIVLADRLMELGDPRGEFIAVQLALANAKPGTKQHGELAEASAALEKQHGAEWSRAVAQHTLKQGFGRGFITFVEVRAAAFAMYGERLFDLAPIKTVRLRNCDVPSLRRVTALPALAKLRELEIQGRLDRRCALALASGKLSMLRVLDVEECGLDAGSIGALVAAAPALVRLVLHEIGEAIAKVVLPHARVVVATRTKPRPGTSTAALEAAGRFERLPPHTE